MDAPEAQPEARVNVEHVFPAKGRLDTTLVASLPFCAQVIHVAFVEPLFEVSAVLDTLWLVVFGDYDMCEASVGLGFVEGSDGSEASLSFFRLSNTLNYLGYGCFPRVNMVFVLSLQEFYAVFLRVGSDLFDGGICFG